MILFLVVLKQLKNALDFLHKRDSLGFLDNHQWKYSEESKQVKEVRMAFEF